jgi:hypothetical protein
MKTMGNLRNVGGHRSGEHGVIGERDMASNGVQPRGPGIDAVMLLLESAIDINPIDETHDVSRCLSVKSVLVECHDD